MASAFVALIIVGLSPSIAYGQSQLFEEIAAQMALSYCYEQKGLRNSNQSAQKLLQFAQESNISPKQLVDLLKSPKMTHAMHSIVQYFGGCDGLLRTLSTGK